jgi:GLPGLI family protein
MKITLLIITSLLCVLGYSQKTNVGLEVEYQFYVDSDNPIKMFTTLFISNNVSIYKVKYSTREKWEEGPSKTNDREVLTDKNAFEPYFKIDHNKKELYFFELMVSNNKFLIKDNYNELKWKISSETKKIGEYNCIKATTNFRGRDWIVWFAPDVPLSFGPWKLHGLPGLILEAHDASNEYSMIAVKLQKKENEIFKKNFSTLIVTKNKEAITLRQFLSDFEEAKNNIRREISGADYTITSLPVVRSGLELKYEWE